MDLLTSDEKEEIKQAQIDVFDTFKEKIIIYKSPLQTYIASANDNSNFNFAFGNDQPLNNVSYTVQSGQFDATIEYIDQQDNQQLRKQQNTRITTTNGYVKICVSGDANEYLKNVEKITFDGDLFDIISDKRPRGMFERIFFDYWLSKTEK